MVQSQTLHQPLIPRNDSLNVDNSPQSRNSLYTGEHMRDAYQYNGHWLQNVRVRICRNQSMEAAQHMLFIVENQALRLVICEHLLSCIQKKIPQLKGETLRDIGWLSFNQFPGKSQ